METVLSHILALALCVGLAFGDCPPRTAGDWERNDRPRLMAGYDKLAVGASCPRVDIALLPQRIVMVDHHVASLDVGIIFDWTDPSLSSSGGDSERMKLNSSEIWMPEIAVEGPESRLLRPRSTADQYTEWNGVGTVTSFYRTTLRGFCETATPEAWPRDEMTCEFHVRPARPASFVLVHSHPIAELMTLVQEFRAKLDAEPRDMQRLAAWQQQSLNSSLRPAEDGAGAIVVTTRLRRLPGQLSVEAVQPVCAVAALVPASAALPPGADARAMLLALAVALHSALLFSLPRLLDDLGGGDPPRTLILYRDLGLLIVVVVLQWLLSLRLASRRRRLPPWGRTLARALAVLRTALLLPATPATPATPTLPTPPSPASKLVDEESIGLSEVLDRLTFFAAGAAYLASVVVSLQ